MKLNDEFQDLNASLNKNTTEKLESFANLLDNMCNYIAESKDKNEDISYLSESIKKQKKIFELAEDLFDKLQETKEAESKVLVNSMMEHFGDFENFVENSTKKE